MKRRDHNKPSTEQVSIKDLGIPARSEMRRLFDRIDWYVGNNYPVYVRCLGGIGRTGTVFGCYCARNGYASDQTKVGRHR